MRFLSKVLTSTAVLGVVGVVNGAIGIQPTDIDLHQQRIGIWNMEEKVGAALPIPTDSEVFSINLSDNSLRDSDVATLMEMIGVHNLTNHVRSLNLSNNRLTLEGVKRLIPLLCSAQLQWLDVSINNLMVDDFHTLWELIEREARRISIIEEIPSYENLRDQWASKVVLLPESYNVERFLLPSAFARAHQQYYQAR